MERGYVLTDRWFQAKYRAIAFLFGSKSTLERT